jgi:TolB-like protein
MANSYAESQIQSLIAVLPLRYSGGISREEAATVTSLLETGLVRSAVFQVVEKSEISEVLAIQEYSHSDHIDRSFAVRVGKLLSAQLILMGTVSRVGDRCFITVKIIEVATGRTVGADKEEADSIEEIASQAEMLGYRLTGFQPERRGENGEPEHANALPSEPLSIEDKIDHRKGEKHRLEEKLESEKERRKSLRKASVVLYGFGAGFAVASGTTLLLYSQEDQQNGSTGSVWGGLSLSFGILGSICAITGTMLWLEQPDLESIEERIEQLEREMMYLAKTNEKTNQIHQTQ